MCLKDVKDDFSKDTQLLLNVPMEIRNIFKATADCLNLFKWLRDKLSGNLEFLMLGANYSFSVGIQ